MYQGLLKHLATLSIAVTCGVADPGPSLTRVPLAVVEDVIDEVEGPSWQGADRTRLLQLLAQDPRPTVRARVAEATSAMWPDARDDALHMLRTLASDRSAHVRAASSRGLEQVLERASLLDRVQVVCEWATSPRWSDRLAVAEALRCPLPCWLADLALEQLAGDEVRDVRWAAIQAAAGRFDEDPAAYAQIALDLVSDPDRKVRHLARRLVVRAG